MPLVTRIFNDSYIDLVNKTFNRHLISVFQLILFK